LDLKDFKIVDITTLKTLGLNVATFPQRKPTKYQIFNHAKNQVT
jgi:hypothetical protein